jgi:hypothetical protein
MNEHLAASILSQFCFIARPDRVGDDIGSDYYCTLFEREGRGKAERIIPRISFAIQVKSNRAVIDVTPNMDYLWNLEIPFFVGVVEQSKWSISLA